MATIDGDKKKLIYKGEEIEQAVTDFTAHKADTTKHITAAERTAWNGNTTNISALQTAVAGKVDKVTGKGLSTEDYTTADKQKLAGLSNYDDTTVQANISALQSGKVDKVTGKGLSTNDYTTTEKQKLAGLSNYDDTEVRGLIATKAAASDLTAETTAREAADTKQLAGIVGLINEGAKNVLNISAAQTQTVNGITFTVNDDYSITCSGTATATAFFSVPVTIPPGAYYFTGMPESGGSSTYRLELRSPTATGSVNITNESDAPVAWGPSSNYTGYFNIRVASGYSFSEPKTVYPMVSERWKYSITDEYVQYRPSLDEMWAMIQALQGGGGA